MRRLRSAVALLGATAALLATAVSPAQATPAGSALAVARAATATYHDVSVATAEGRFALSDLAGISCIDNPGVGAMGVHYVDGALVGDGEVDATRPEAVIYEPRSDGSLRLVAVEYVVLAADWAAKHSGTPSLFGQDFELVHAGNRYGLPDFYELHAWLWRHNPLGMFDDWNPEVTCP